MSLFLQKSTPCGRFTVTIESQTPEQTVLLRQDMARSAKALSDLLTEAATSALGLAVAILDGEECGRSRHPTGAVDG